MYITYGIRNLYYIIINIIIQIIYSLYNLER